MMGHPRKGAAQRPLVAIFGLTGPDEFCLRGPGAPPTQNPRVARSASSDSAEDDDPMLEADVEETSNLGLFSGRGPRLSRARLQELRPGLGKIGLSVLGNSSADSVDSAMFDTLL